MYVELDRYVLVPGSGVVTLGLACGAPYKNYTGWVYCGSTPNLSVQPKFGGVNDGAAVTVNAVGPKKVFQVAVDEIRPSTNPGQNPSDDSVAPSLISQLVITNNDADDIMVGVYMVALSLGVV
jgi:hypothetical protein